MPASKIIFTDEDYKFMKDYKDAHGVSIQRFVTTSIQEMILKLKMEQQINDLKHTQDGTIHQ